MSSHASSNVNQQMANYQAAPIQTVQNYMNSSMKGPVDPIDRLVKIIYSAPAEAKDKQFLKSILKNILEYGIDSASVESQELAELLRYAMYLTSFGCQPLRVEVL